jgi:hypothetical protein
VQSVESEGRRWPHCHVVFKSSMQGHWLAVNAESCERKTEHDPCVLRSVTCVRLNDKLLLHFMVLVFVVDGLLRIL